MKTQIAKFYLFTGYTMDIYEVHLYHAYRPKCGMAPILGDSKEENPIF